MIYIQLLESMSLIALAAYIYNQSTISKKLFYKNYNTPANKLGIIFFFTVLSIIGTYTGVNINPISASKNNVFISSYAIANTRPIGAITAGYIGGPAIGIIVGSLAGFHRLSIGGFTALACGISTIVEGLCGGIAHEIGKKKHLDSKLGFIAAVIAEILQMIIILAFSTPFNDAFELEKLIAFPMIIINSLGVVIFINITNNAFDQYNRISALQAQKALIIAEQTLNYLKKGFNKTIAENVAKIIYDNNNYKTVFIADKEKILCYCGEIIDINKLNFSIKPYYKFADYRIISYKNETNNRDNLFFCIPIFDENNLEMIVGLKVKSERQIDYYFTLFAKQLSSLLSTQMQIYKLNKIAHEACIAEYKALRSQIHPHFLFNALNTISSFCRTNPSKARELIIDLSNYFRQTLKREEDFVTIKEEFEFLRSYLSIENARFGERLNVKTNIPKNLLNYKVPVFILQPIIENSIKHGILPKPSGGAINIDISLKHEELFFSIKDDGVGFNACLSTKTPSTSTGIGLKNVNERLKLLYGEKHFLKIKSIPGKGTIVSFSIPKEANL
ncbi:LytS/YhcK type 5TM receptor domain-containing protein [Clostridium rectalis]|uniref:LytS/YhcK type 5TM receptor domain-containing protein n=1 Tax=Clostridium rectalis TaxID=2040295 RepID=UPI000F63C98D|nr:LytS/YhcK type 5TM receptor domain-containing protein [Clostridium rectalis]